MSNHKSLFSPRTCLFPATVEVRYFTSDKLSAKVSFLIFFTYFLPGYAKASDFVKTTPDKPPRRAVTESVTVPAQKSSLVPQKPYFHLET